MTWPGIMIASPSASPANDDSTVTPLAPLTARRMPTTASGPVTTFGTRRVLRSIQAPAPAPTTSVPTTTRSEGSSNGPPQHVVDRISNRSDATNRHEPDQTSEQRVFDQILPVVILDETNNHTAD